MFKRKKKKTGVQTPEFRKPTPLPPMPPVKPPKPKEFEDAQNMLIIPKHDKIETWVDSDYIPYKDEITIAYDDIKIIYKIGDGIHIWNELHEVSLEDVVAKGYVYYNGGINRRYKVRFKFFPERYM